jgi:hypothetical protein
MNQHRLPAQIPPPCPATNARSRGWAAWVHQQWPAVRVTHITTRPLHPDIAGHLRVLANVHLAALSPADVLVEATADRADTARDPDAWPIRLCSAQSYRNGIYVFEGLLPPHGVEERCPLTVRVRPGVAHETFTALGDVAQAFDVRRDVAAAGRKARRARAEPVGW